MRVEAVALMDFVHGDINAVEGRICRHRGGELISEGVARDLELAGRVRIRTTPRGANPMPPDPSAKPEAGKPQDDGQGQPSSASQAAPPSAPLTSSSLKPGGGKTRKADA